MKLFYLFDTKANLPYYPKCAVNKDVILREIATDLRRFRENKSYSVIACWGDSKLYELDLDKKESVEIPEFRAFFSAPEKVEKDDGKENK